MEEVKKEKYVPKILAIIAFSIVLSLLVGAIVFDAIMFFEAIVTFIVGILACAIVFFILFLAMILSCILIFGFYIIDNYGFWPLNATESMFKDMMGDIRFTPEQIQLFSTVRIIILALLIACFILAVISSKMHKTAKELNDPNVRVCKPFNVITIIFSILGIMVGTGMIFLVTNF